MTLETDRLSAELLDELASNERRLPDPASMPIRFHNLHAMAQSALHCLYSFADSRTQSLPIRIGAGTHAMTFGQPVTMWPGKVRNGKVWDAFKSEHFDKVILNRKEWAQAEAISNALRSHREASMLLFGDGVVHEQTIEWEQLGRSRRSTPDVRHKHYIAELKSTRCAQPDRFVRDATFRAYNAQLADQMNAAEYLTGHRPEKAYIVAVESVPPHAVTVLELTERAIERGDRLCRLWLEQLLSCERSGSWPGYCESISSFDIPDDDVELVFAADGDEP